MDPEEALRQIRELIVRIQGNTDPRAPWDELAEELAEKTEGLDNWLRMGGFLPQDWNPNKTSGSSETPAQELARAHREVSLLTTVILDAWVNKDLEKLKRVIAEHQGSDVVTLAEAQEDKLDVLIVAATPVLEDYERSLDAAEEEGLLDKEEADSGREMAKTLREAITKVSAR